MRRTVVLLAAFVGLGLWVGNARLGAEEKKPGKPEPPSPKQPGGGEHKDAHGEKETHEEWVPVPVGPEHKRLHDFVGTWKIEHKMWHMPDSEPFLSTGTFVATLTLDGLAVISEMQTTGPEGTFKGHGLTTWIVAQKKYQGAWLDVYSYNGILLSFGTYDEAAKTWNWQFERTGPGGEKMPPLKSITKVESKDRMSEDVFTIDTDGKEWKTMAMTYTRIK
ncbi:MAG: DUF1579 family protein [Planctomycetota bacterium]